MKKLNILRFLSTVAIAAAGVFGIASVKESKKVESAEAASTACDVYFKASWSGANITIAKVHYWNGGDFWQDMTEVYTDNGAKVYKYTIPAGNTEFQYQTYTSNWGSGEWHTSVNKTVSQNLLCWPVGGDSAWDGNNFKLNTGSAYPYTINYNGNGNTSGTMTSETAYGNVSWGLKANTFVRTGYIFNGWNTQSDGKGTSYANQALVPSKNNTNALTLYAQWRKSYTTGKYIIGHFGSCDWSMENAQLMSTSGSDKVATITFAYGDKFKSANYNDSTGVISYEYGYSKLYNGCGAYNYFSNGDYDNIVCYARGTYTIYVNSTNISIEVSGSLTSEHLAAKLMSFGENPSSGHCQDNDRFPQMKGIYNGLSYAEQQVFQGYSNSEVDQFHNAYLRYCAWARANGEVPFTGSKTSAALLLSLNNQASNNIAVLLIISVVSVGAIGGYFFIRKRKENN